MHPEDRKQQRLEIARRLLNLPEGTNIPLELKKLLKDDLERLRGIADWVEEYENVFGKAEYLKYRKTEK